MEVNALHTNTIVITTKFLYDHIFIWFGCPFTIIINQGTHFINDVICYLRSNHFILRHTNFTIYYPQGNGRVEFTNKVFGTLFTKLLNKN